MKHVYKARQIAKSKVNVAEKYIHSIVKHNKNGERMNNVIKTVYHKGVITKSWQSAISVCSKQQDVNDNGHDNYDNGK